MVNEVHLKSEVSGSEIRHHCSVSGPVSEAFLSGPQTGELAARFGVRWPQIDTYPVDLGDLPPSIAVIPALTNLLPIAWVYGAEVFVDEIDAGSLSPRRL